MIDSYMKSYMYSEGGVVEIRNNVLNVTISRNTVLAYTLSFNYYIYFICFLYFKTSSLRLIHIRLNWPAFFFFNS